MRLTNCSKANSKRDTETKFKVCQCALQSFTINKTCSYLVFKGRYNIVLGFASGSVIKNPPAIQETLIRPWVRKTPLEKGMATHSSVPAWKIPWTEEHGCQDTVHGVAKSLDMTKHTHSTVLD